MYKYRIGAYTLAAQAQGKLILPRVSSADEMNNAESRVHE